VIDRLARPHIVPIIDNIASRTAQAGFTANKLTLIAFAFGLAGCFAVGMQQYALGLVLLMINRFVDGLAGSVARQNGTTELGTILDTLCDYLVFAGFAFFFALSAMETILASTLLIFSFLAMGMAYLAHAWVMTKKNIGGIPSGGVVENGEMIGFILLCCILPAYYAAFATVFALLCWTTAILRFTAASKLARS
jgi:phosphatidylglycerophosphate synthase